MPETPLNLNGWDWLWEVEVLKRGRFIKLKSSTKKVRFFINNETYEQAINLYDMLYSIFSVMAVNLRNSDD
jgi:hypothetical protein